MSPRIDSVAHSLGRAIYYGRAQAFELDVAHWDALDNATKTMYVAQAQDILQANRPVMPNTFGGGHARL